MSNTYLIEQNDLNTATENTMPFALAFCVRGNDWAERGELDRAIADYDAALRFSPRDAKAIRNRSLNQQVDGCCKRDWCWPTTILPGRSQT